MTMRKYYIFKPLLKTLIWGTESWQISGVAGSETLSTDGESLNDIVRREKALLTGKANYERFGNEFPLLIKFINTHDSLSVQVHPNDETAHRLGKPRGKTEMWYVMDSLPSATLYNGLSRQLTPEEYRKKVADGTILDALAKYSVKEGDCFFIPAGRIHAIGAGCRLTEIQQTSDVTFRIYDYGRRDKDGNQRQLHTEEAAQSIDFTVLPDYRQRYTPRKNESQLLVECPYFSTAVYDIDEPMLIDYSELDSFVVLIGLKGEGTLTIDGEQVAFREGESVLVAATAENVCVEGTMKFLETYVI